MWDQWLEAALEKTSYSPGSVASFLYGLEWWRWLLILLGIGMITAGLFILIQSSRSELIISPTSEIVATTSAKLAPVKRKTIYVDVAGAVARPNLYELAEGARAGAAIAAAGGLTSQAHQVYLRKNFNSALTLQDGQKLYIPFAGEDVVATPGEKTTSAPIQAGTPTTNGGTSINTASSDELDALPGIGVARVEQIIAGRPYTRLEELTEKQILTASVYASLAGLITL